MSKEEIKALVRVLVREHSNPEYMDYVRKMNELETEEEHLFFRETIRKETKIYLSEMEEEHNTFLNKIRREMKGTRKAGTGKSNFCSVEGMVNFSLMGEA